MLVTRDDVEARARGLRDALASAVAESAAALSDGDIAGSLAWLLAIRLAGSPAPLALAARLLSVLEDWESVVAVAVSIPAGLSRAVLIEMLRSGCLAPSVRPAAFALLVLLPGGGPRPLAPVDQALRACVGSARGEPATSLLEIACFGGGASAPSVSAPLETFLRRAVAGGVDACLGPSFAREAC